MSLSAAGAFFTLARLLYLGAPEEAAPALRLENDFLRLEVGSSGRCLGFTDKRGGKDYLARGDGGTGAPLARVRLAGRELPSTAASAAGGRLTLQFGEAGVIASLSLAAERKYLAAEVVSLEGPKDGPAVEEFIFIDIPLSLRGSLSEPFAACLLALNLKTNVGELPGPAGRLRASCYPRFGFAGAKAAILGCSPDELRRAMQEAVSAAPELPHSPIGGPWALEAEINRGSYLFNFGNLTEQTVEDWIRLARSLGMNQIDFHGGGSFRFGDCEPNRDMYPRGRASLKAVIDRLHEAGIKAGLHTYAFFIDKRCPWVTPVPDPRLGKDASFTLAEPLAADRKSAIVAEPTGEMSAVTGFFVRNSAVLQIGDELLIYSGVQKDPPYAFTGCQRGAHGTRAAAHEKGAAAHHLKECFGLFTPGGDSTLLAEVAARAAEMYNACGFDMMYLDALDGEDVLGGAASGWHYGSKFVFELWKRLERPALMEMSTFHHHLWYVRSRLGAWDHPSRSHKKFIDIHCSANEDGRRTFLPMHLGWWAVKAWSGAQGEPTFADDLEYLCTKALATDTGFSLMGVDPASFAKNPALQRLGAITRQYESLRHEKYFSEAIKARLRAPGEEFTLERSPEGKWRFRPVQYSKHKVEGLDGPSGAWKVRNKFKAQPLMARLEALLSAEPYEAPGGITAVDFKAAEELPDRAAAPGIRIDLEISAAVVKAGSSSGCLKAANSTAARGATWARLEKTFAPPLNLGGQQALGLWVRGDGRGEVLNLQLRSPEHLVGGIGDHYIPIDFAGWRYFELIEPEGERHALYTWPYGSIYDIYRESVNYGQVKSLSLWVNHLPPDGSIEVYLGPIRALPLVQAKLRRPRLAVAGKTIVFPIEMESGSTLELKSSSDCKLYGPDGALLREVVPEGELPILGEGENDLAFSCEAPANCQPRARITVMAAGEPLGE